jgi:hypothetical protein
MIRVYLFSAFLSVLTVLSGEKYRFYRNIAPEPSLKPFSVSSVLPVSHINEASDERVVKNTAFIENAKAGFRVVARNDKRLFVLSLSQCSHLTQW